MEKRTSPDSGTYKLGENGHKQPYYLEYYTDSTTQRRVYSLKRGEASQRDNSEVVNNLNLELLRRLAKVTESLEP